MRPWLLLVLLVEVMTYAETQADLNYGDTLSTFGGFMLTFNDAKSTSGDTDNILTGEVVSVFDGNTFDLKSGSVRHRVQLVGIDAPEIGQTFGVNAKYYLLDSVESHPVKVQVHGRSRSGDVLGELFVNQISINKMMLKDGYAWATRGFRADRNLQGLEEIARNQGVGLWRDRDATSPWEFRKQLANQ